MTRSDESKKKQTFLSNDTDTCPTPSPVPLTCRPDQLHGVVHELVPLADGADVRTKVLEPNVLDGERDAAGPVAHVVAAAAPLEGLVFDVVAQQLVVGVPPLDGQLGQRRALLVGVEARQRGPAARLTQDSDHSSYKHKQK